MSRSLSRSRRTLNFPRPDLERCQEGPAIVAPDTEPDYPDDATTRLLRTDLMLLRPPKSKKDNSHLLPSVIVDENAVGPDRTVPFRRVPAPPTSHVRPVERHARSHPSLQPHDLQPRGPSMAVIALLVSVGVLAARLLPLLGHWIERALR
jgi:hypothetical protein